MDDSIRTVTTEHLLDGLVFQLNNLLGNSLGYGQRAIEELDSSHPAFRYVKVALQQAERAWAVVREVGDEIVRRKSQDAPMLRADMAAKECPLCNRLFGDHSAQEFASCFNRLVRGDSAQDKH